jgi:hypothetical protein
LRFLGPLPFGAAFWLLRCALEVLGSSPLSGYQYLPRVLPRTIRLRKCSTLASPVLSGSAGAPHRSSSAATPLRLSSAKPSSWNSSSSAAAPHCPIDPTLGCGGLIVHLPKHAVHHHGAPIPRAYVLSLITHLKHPWPPNTTAAEAIFGWPMPTPNSVHLWVDWAPTANSVHLWVAYSHSEFRPSLGGLDPNSSAVAPLDLVDASTPPCALARPTQTTASAVPQHRSIAVMPVHHCALAMPNQSSASAVPQHRSISVMPVCQCALALPWQSSASAVPQHRSISVMPVHHCAQWPGRNNVRRQQCRSTAQSQ